MFESESFEWVNLIVIRNEEDYRDFCDGGEDQLVVMLNLDRPKRDLLNEVRQLLKDHHPRKRGRPEMDDSINEYRLASRPDIRHVITHNFNIHQ